MITNLDDITRAAATFREIFSSTNPFEPVGRPELPVRVLLFPTDGYYLQRKQFEALVRAAESCNDTNFFVSEVEASDPFDPKSRWKRQHWECSNLTYDEYLSLPLAIENALYSRTALWGVLLSHELHGLLVCQERFWRVFENSYPRSGRDLEEFIQYWARISEESGTDPNWLPSFVAHLTQHK